MKSAGAAPCSFLGDLFEVWVGDDRADKALNGSPGFECQCGGVGNAAKRLSLSSAWRPSLSARDAFARAAGATLLLDPSTLRFDDKTWLLTHGDTLCLHIRPTSNLVDGLIALPRSPFSSRPLAQRGKSPVVYDNKAKPSRPVLHRWSTLT